MSPWGRRRCGLWRAMALRVGIAQVAGTALVAAGQHQRHQLDALAFALLLIGPLALVWRRQRPLLVLAVNFLSTGSYYTLDYRFGPAFLSLLVAVVTAVRERGLRDAAVGTTIGYLGYVSGSLALNREHVSMGQLAVAASVVSVALLLGNAARLGRQRAGDLAAIREEERKRRRGEERLRMAQELHDTLGHHLSLINVQAGVALHLPDDPARSQAALSAIKDASHAALEDLRSVLGVLRDQEAPRAPLAGLARLPDLVDQSRAAGLPVELTIGDLPDLPGRVDIAVYRIVQEALTNVRRHAVAATGAHVTVQDDGRSLTVTVHDNGRRVGEVREGGGLTGMRERTLALGGTLAATPAPDGFWVTATLPL